MTINTSARKFSALAFLAFFSARLAATALQNVPLVLSSKSSREMPATNLAIRLPRELVDSIFDLLPPTDVWTTQRVCKSWHNRFWGYDKERREQLTEPERAFGASKWLKYYGLEVTDAPRVPAEILALLDQECGIWPGRKVAETHLLTLIPKGLTLNQLAELIQLPLNGGHPTEYRDYSDYVNDAYGTTPVPASYWVLMARHILPNSRNQTLDHQRALVAQQAQRTGFPYAMPGVVEAAASIVTHFVEHGELLYGDGKQDVHAWNDNKQPEWYTYTRCEQKVNNNQPSVVVGSFSSAGLYVFLTSPSGHRVYGVSAVVRSGLLGPEVLDL